jgi:glycerol-3-phosphate dehydrogenase
VRLEGHEQLRDHASVGAGANADGATYDGILSVAGTKYTTARAVAERVTNRVVAKLGQPSLPCRTAVTPLPGGDLGDVSTVIARARREFDDRLPSDTIPHLVAAYGSRYQQVLDIAANRPEWRTRLAEESPVIGAEIVWAVGHEMAMTLTDAIVRRTPLGALGFPGEASAERAAAIMAGELQWSDERIRAEVAALRAFYRPF